LGTNERAHAIDVAQRTAGDTGGEPKVELGDLTRARLAGLIAVGVPVEIQQAGSSSTLEREEVPEQDAAVSAEHDRELAPVKDAPDLPGQGLGVAAYRRSVEDMSDWITIGAVGGRLHKSRATRVERLSQPVSQQRVTEMLNAGWPEPEY
jgi:hypothetical protein